TGVAYGSARAAVESLKAGAFDFVSKPVNLDVLRKLVDAALKPAPAAGRSASEEVLQGTSPGMGALRTLVERVALSQAPVHIAGESGSGKERVARLIHASGPRAAGPFVPVNCGAIPNELMESEFFGHRKGSFTGALRDKEGLFQAAENGTLFLDEVADLPLHMQVKLLRAVQERSVRPVGTEQEVPVNVRLISATHRDLSALTAAGTFRQDLYYRLNVIEVRVPALRERREDIPQLVTDILARLARENRLPKPPVLEPAALRRLLDYDFPGNVRELENVLERAVTLSGDAGPIGADGLILRGLPGAASAVPPLSVAAGNTPLEQHVEEVEKRAIRDALDKTRGNKTKAASLLGMTFRQLRYRVKKLKIE
ncbi:MAG: sigma-54 dependent transcriptional regulator, partial [Nevskiales bacterium]|nr:sigma-54 dependent transcriptional regulator [Nevskiales bacterium]